VVAKICTALTAAVPIETACAIGGIGKTAFFEWLKAKPEFAEAIKKAQAQAEAGLVAVIRTAAIKQWTAAAWILERHPKYRERWAKPTANTEPGAQASSTTSPPPPIVSTRETVMNKSHTQN